MAVADLLVTVFCIVAEAAWTATVAWLADEVTCKGLKYMQVGLMTTITSHKQIS